MQLRIYRGTREIGGSCVELASNGSRILLDLGMPLVERDGAPFDAKRHRNVDGPGLVERGVLPNVQGLYPWVENEASVDGLFISHAHLDHCGLASYVRQDVPIFVSNDTLCLMRLSEQFVGFPAPFGDTRTFNAGDRIACGPFVITPYLVDHSAYGAVAFHVEAGGKRVLYSGDFRDHGRKAKTLDYLTKHVAPEVDALLLEGTMLGREAEEVMTEDQLERKAIDLMRRCPKAVFIYQSGQNIDRLVSFYRAALQADRLFVVDLYVANVLEKLCAARPESRLPRPSSDFPRLKVFFPSALTDKMIESGQAASVMPLGRYKITRPEIAAQPDKVVMTVRPSMEADLGRVGDLRDSLLIYSMWQGYLETGQTKAFLERLVSRGARVEHLHTSGHASIQTLGGLVDALRPRRLIPVHTYHPEAYSQFGPNVVPCADGEAIML